MQFWEGGGVVTLLVAALLMVLVRGLARSIPGWRKLAVPDVMLAGAAILAVGPGGFGLIPLETGIFEGLVYHGLALVYIAMGLSSPEEGKGGAGSRSVAVMHPFITAMQAFVGLALALGWGMAVASLHPGFGAMLPLGFSQGPGQALALGNAWEEKFGMVDGGQVGLMVAAAGYAWCCVLGVGLFHLGRALGWSDPPLPIDPDAAPGTTRVSLPTSAPGELEGFTSNAALVGMVYLATWGLLTGLSGALAGKEQLVAMIWGFHWIIGLLLALGVRAAFGVATKGKPIGNDVYLGLFTGLVVDLTAMSAIAAVRLDVVGQYLPPVMLIATVGVVVTAVLCLWTARRSFEERPFSHALVMFGTLTGTLPTGLALLRLEDPELKGPAVRNAVMGLSQSVLFGIPTVLIFLPMAVRGWGADYPGPTLQAMGALAVWMVILLVIWPRYGQLKLTKPTQLWPKEL